MFDKVDGTHAVFIWVKLHHGFCVLGWVSDGDFDSASDTAYKKIKTQEVNLPAIPARSGVSSPCLLDIRYNIILIIIIANHIVTHFI